MEEKIRDEAIEQQLYWQKIVKYDFEEANIPMAFFKSCEVDPHLQVQLDQYVGLWSADERRTRAKQGLIFCAGKIDALQHEAHVAYVLVNLMKKRRTAYFVSCIDLEKTYDEEFIDHLVTRDILGIVNFPYNNLKVQPDALSQVTNLHRVLLKRHHKMNPTLFSCEVPFDEVRDYFKLAPRSVVEVIQKFNEVIEL